MAVQNPFFGKRENDSFPPRNSVTGLSTANSAATSGASSLSSAGLGTAPSSSMRASAAPAAPVAEESGGSKLTVGPNIKLKGVEITDCDTLVVEGTVEATMNSRVIKIAEQGCGFGQVQTKRPGSMARVAAGAGIDRAIGALLRGGQGCADIGAGAGAVVGQAQVGQLGQGCIVSRLPGGLVQDRNLPIQAKPVQIVENRGLPFGFAAGAVDILDPEQEAVATRGGDYGGIGMAQMQRAGRRGGEAGYPSHAVKESLARSV